MKQTRKGRSRTKNNSTHRNRSHSHSRSRSHVQFTIPNTESNTNSNTNINENGNPFYGRRIRTVDDQLLYAVRHQEGHDVKEECRLVKAILDKIAGRSGDRGGGNPKNRLMVSTVERALRETLVHNSQFHNVNREHRSITVAILDTLLSHPLFKNIKTRDYKTREYTPYDVPFEALILAVRHTTNLPVIRYLVQDRGVDPAAKECSAVIIALYRDKHYVDQGYESEMTDILDYFMEQPSMRKWNTLELAIQSLKHSRVNPLEKKYCIYFFVYHMFSLIEDTSLQSTKERIIYMHDNYRDYMADEERDKINQLYAMVTISLNTRTFPTNIHKLLSTY